MCSCEARRLYNNDTHELPRREKINHKKKKKKAVCSVSHCLMSGFNEQRCNYNWPNFSYPRPPGFTDTILHSSVSLLNNNEACFRLSSGIHAMSRVNLGQRVQISSRVRRRTRLIGMSQ